jgi:hypothetical protein
MAQIAAGARPGTVAAPIRQQWAGSYPTARLDHLPEGQQETATGVLGDPWELSEVWRVWKPGVSTPPVDFDREIVLFARNTRYLNRLRIGAITLRDGLASVETIETRSAIPIEDECFLAMAVVPRAGLHRADTGTGAVDVPPPPRATSAYVQGDGSQGAVYATIRGKEHRIADSAWNAWVRNGGRDLLYSRHASGGYENEGQSLYRVSVPSGVVRRLGAWDVIVRKVLEARSRRGKLVYVVTLSDSAVGAPATAVVHPERGQVYLRRDARVARIANGRVALNIFRRGASDTGEPGAVKPVRTLVVDLDRLLIRR